MKRINNDEIQKYILDILKHIDYVCKKNDIKYFLSSGTCLGAIRHKGFIPWDNDADIFMERSEYDRFKEIMKRDNSNFRYVDNEIQKDYFYPFAKVIDTRTYLEEKEFKKIKNYGIYVDVFPVDGLPDDEKERIKHMKAHGFFGRLIAFKKKRTKNKLKLAVKRMLTCFIPLRFIIKMSDKDAKKYSTKNTKYSMDIVWGNKIFSSSVVKDIVDTKFEGCDFPVPKEYDLYLKTIYGDYMKLPKVEDRFVHKVNAYLK